MTTATLNRTACRAAQSDSNVFQQFMQSAQVTVGALFSVREQLQKFDQLQRLLRESNRCAATDGVKSAALRAKAFALID